jgi:hypothetical protein
MALAATKANCRARVNRDLEIESMAAKTRRRNQNQQSNPQQPQFIAKGSSILTDR